MPCNYVIQTSVKLSAADLDVLKQALESLGYTVHKVGAGLTYSNYQGTGTFKNGELRHPQSMGLTEDAVKQAYSKAAVKVASKKYGWNVQENKANPMKIKLTRRY